VRNFSIILISIAILTIFCLSLFGDDSIKNHDWAMWRYDANRSASSPLELPEMLYLQWVREYPKLKPTWDDPLNQDLMQFGKVYEPVVLGKTLFVGSSASDWVTALDTETGEEKWIFYADAPIKLPLVADKGKVYFTSDDGHLYCLDAVEGKLIWKFRGGPTDRKVLGNERIISTWLARGGAVLKDGVIYFAAGIWPFMGIFIYALDAETGKVIWANDSTGPIYMNQPHNSPSYAGVAPQGTLVISGDRLLVPCGRSVPACFDRNTGKMLYYHLAEYNKSGGAFVAALGDLFVNYHRDYVTSLYSLADGKSLIPKFGKIPVMTDQAFYCMGDEVIAYELGKIVKYEKKVEMVKVEQWVVNQRWKCSVDATGDLIKAGNRLYAGGKGIVSAIDIPKSKEDPIVSWKVRIDGTVARIIAADSKLFVVTLEGNIFAFGGDEVKPKIHEHIPKKPVIAENVLNKAKSILETTGISDGYCLAYGLETGDLIMALAENSKLRIIALDTDPAKVDQLRRKFNATGLYGERISVQVGDPFTFRFPPYIASLIVVENADLAKNVDFLKSIYPSIRPYGGTACLITSENITTQIQEIGLPQAKIKFDKSLLLLTKDGPLPNSADWTHQYGDIANTVKSDDQLVKLPLGILWFGGNSNMDVLPRHGHGPPEQVIGGRLFIVGIGLLNARDVYTGRLLWQKKLPKMDTFGVYYNETYADTPLDTAYNQVHIPGANARGTNFVATLDKVYIIQKEGCLVLDSATGDKITEFKLPEDPKTGRPSEWGYIGVYKDYLIAGAGFVSYDDFLETDLYSSSKKDPFYNYDVTSSKKLVVMDRNTGKIYYTLDSKLGFRHSAIAVWNDMLFCIDRLPNPVYNTLKRRGEKYPSSDVATLTAYNLTNGDLIWNNTENIFGTWLGYSKEHDILIQATRSSRDMIRDEPGKGMTAYRASDGKILWNIDVAYGGPVMLHDESIITDRYAYDLLTGEQKMRADPLTGKKTHWEFKRNYGCNYVIASEYLLTFRSAAAGFFDLSNDGGTGSFGGFKSGCTSNLVSANGVLNAPDYTRTCSCSYQNQTSLAMVYDPDVEIWTEYPSERVNEPIKSIGINFGAPGDRMSDDGILWLEYPIVGGPSPVVPVSINPEKYERFIHHSSKIQGDGLKWVTASGIKGISSVKITLAEKTEQNKTVRPYTVRLYFSDPDDINNGQRVFDVSIQGQKVLTSFDIIKETGGRYNPIVKEFKGIKVSDDLIVEFTPSNSDKSYTPLICGMEIRNED
jgi:outer membrane protein assembly factor BamB